MDAVPRLFNLCLSRVADGYRLHSRRPDVSYLRLPRHIRSYLLPILSKRGLLHDHNLDQASTAVCVCVCVRACMWHARVRVCFLSSLQYMLFSWYEGRNLGKVVWVCTDDVRTYVRLPW